MIKKTLTGFTLPLLLLLGNSSGTLQKMIVETGTVTMDLNINRLNGIGFASHSVVHLQFVVAANPFFSILVFNDLLRGAEAGSIALLPQQPYVLPSRLGTSIKQLI